ncbi:MAG: LysM domain-containing protein [Desulfuromonadales bacterium]
MSLLSDCCFRILISVCLLAHCGASAAGAAMDSRFELDPTTLSGAKKASTSAVKGRKRTHPAGTETMSPLAEQGGIYTVRQGEHLFKKVMRDFGLSYVETASFIEEIRLENNIHDIRRLKSGQKIIIPPLHRRADGSLKLIRSLQSDPGTIPERSFTLESPELMLTGQEVVGRIRETWDRIVPVKPDLLKPISLKTPIFSLTLDAERYPVFSTMDGGRILLDQGGAMPSLIKALIQEKEPSLRIVSDSPSDRKKLLVSMLEAGGFYSVEENFNMDFGVDPKLSFHADVKLEKSPDSLIRQDVVLMNSTLAATPSILCEFLKKEGFSLYEPFASSKRAAVRTSRPVHQITAKHQPEIVDAILKALSISSDRDRRLDVFATDNNGISLAVKAERYFERGGERFVITGFDGDPVNYTLFRVLDAKGIRVVILNAQDDFRKVAEKILSGMKIKGTFAMYDLLQNSAASYSLQMSGFNLDDAELPDGGLFLTNIEMDRIIRDLLTENGYSINGR